MGKIRCGRNNELWFSDTSKKCIRNSKLNLRNAWNGKTGKIYILQQNRNFPSSALRTNCPKSERFSIECGKTKNQGNHKVYQKRGKYQKNLTLSPASNFSLQYHHWITHQCHENEGNDHQLKKLSIVRQIVLVSTLVTVQRAVRECEYWC